MSAPAEGPFLLPLPLDRVTALALDDGAKVEVHGQVATAADGHSFDAMELFDFEAGGLRVVGHGGARDARHDYVLAATGEEAKGCSAVGVPSPCFVPRLAVLAHERLRTVQELSATLSGGVELEAPPTVDPSVAIAGKLMMAASCIAAALTVLWVAVILRRRLARTGLGRVRIAARLALRATAGDATLERVREQVRALVDRALEHERVRRACLRKMRRIDRPSLEHRADACARSSVPEAAGALACLAAERAEALRLESDFASSAMELERIESALRIVALRARQRRGQSSASDPVEALVLELDLRDQAFAEADTH